MSNHHGEPHDELRPMTSFAVLICHLFWIFGGPIVLSFLTLKLATTKDGWTTPYDIGFPIVLAATVAARWYCFRSGDILNSMGEITTMDQLRRYTRVFLVGGMAVWIAANLIANVARR